MQQIILITDGCSNVGLSPVVAAAQAQAEEIVVNVIGVIDDSPMGGSGHAEISQIAEAGGGMSRFVSSRQLAQTMQMMTRKTVVNTIQQIVGKELRTILGHDKIEELPPTERAQVVKVIDELGETSSLRVALLIDCSASMKDKLPAVREAIRDLLLSLQARNGKSEICVFHFPGGTYGEEAQLDADWTTELAKVENLFYKLIMKGTTPTGPAILTCIRHMVGQNRRRSLDEGGLLSDYVV
ncbi:MAG: hypothetical protein K0R75_1326 [Paenibacillaceae bacterium]|jgi:Ca-activated chloride channel family protein|nr:hypothetical protein [Paenibacillaceae bacterium]